MGAEVQRDGGEYIRPTWRYTTKRKQGGGYTYPGDEIAQLEMLESIRNMLERIAASQMLQCDVRSAIYDIRNGQRRAQSQDEARFLERMARRVRKTSPDESAALLKAAARLRKRRIA